MQGGGYHDWDAFVVGDTCGPTGNVYANRPDDCSP
jgi:hypothetical protein